MSPHKRKKSKEKIKEVRRSQPPSDIKGEKDQLEKPELQTQKVAERPHIRQELTKISQPSPDVKAENPQSWASIPEHRTQQVAEKPPKKKKSAEKSQPPSDVNAERNLESEENREKIEDCNVQQQIPPPRGCIPGWSARRRVETRRPKGERPPTVQRSVKRCHLLEAIKAVKNYDPEKAPKRICHYVFPNQIYPGWTKPPVCQSQRMHLLLVLRNAIIRHDWSTAAVALRFMIESKFRSSLIHPPFFQIFFNHPQSTDESVTQFLSEALNLRSQEEQKKFLGHLFHLPQDFDIYKTTRAFLDRESSDESS